MFDEVESSVPANGQAAGSQTDTAAARSGPVQLAQAPGEPIGSVEELAGGVTLTRTDGTTVTAAAGDPVYLNDTVATSADGSVEITFVDGTRFSLGQNGQMTLDQLVYDPGGSSNELDLSVIQGAFTFVTGSIAGAPGEGMEVNVPVGTIGIRGTAVGGGPDTGTADPNDYTIVLLPEEGGAFGRIVLTDTTGRSVILDAPLEAMDISTLGLAPGDPVQLTRDQVLDLLGAAVENIEDVLEEIQNFENLEDQNPEAGPQEGELIPSAPNTGGINQQAGETQTLDELTSLFTLADQQGLGNTGPLGGFTPTGGLGDSDFDDTGDDDTSGAIGPDDNFDPEDEEAPSTLVTITGSEGDDTLDATEVGPANIIGLGGDDILIGSDGDDILTGGEGDDILDPNAGNDQAFGGGGNDIFVGGTGIGNDLLDGGAGNDSVSYISATQGINVNLTAGTASGDPAIGSDTLVSIENVAGGQGNDVISGNEVGNLLLGREGNDILAGLDGEDSLVGQEGNDTLLGGSGNDNLDGGAGSDTLSGDGGNDVLVGGEGVDVAVFGGNRDDYTITGAEGGFIITDNREGANDGIDFVAGDIEVIRFADGQVATNPILVDDTDTVSADDAVDRTATNGAAMKTGISVTAGAVLTMRFNFLDSEPDTAEGTFKDFAAIVIGDQVIKLADVDQAELPFAVVGTSFDEQTGFWTYSFTFTEGGDYMLGLVVANEDDQIFDAGLLVDSISISDGSLTEGFESGLEGWQTAGQVTTVGAYGGVSPPSGEQQALLLTQGGEPASELEAFLGLAPGQLSDFISQPSISGNVLSNDGLGGGSVEAVVYTGDPEDVTDLDGSQSGNIVTFTASDGSWELRFDVSNGTYVFTVLGPIDYAGSGTLSLPFQYTVEGLGGATGSAALTIVVEDGLPAANQAPVAVNDPGNGYDFTVNEDDDPLVLFDSDLLANDSDPEGDTLYVTAVGNAVGGTVTLGAEGVITFTPTANYSGPASFTYTVSDGNGGTDTATVNLTVEPVNDAPAITSNGGGDEATVVVAENGTAVTTVQATDPDTGQTLTYSIIGGADAARFTINPATGALSFIEAPDYEAFGDADEDNVYDVIVQSSDGQGGTDTQAIGVAVTDVAENEAPGEITDEDAEQNIVSRYAANGSVVGIMAASVDPDGDAITYSLADDSISSIFAIDPETGEITVGNQEFLRSHAGGTNLSVTVIATDASGAQTEKAFDIAVTANGTDRDDHLVGTLHNDALHGLGGDDLIEGGDGDDELYGEEGDDIFVSGDGDDIVNGGYGFDTVDYSGESDSVSVDLGYGEAWMGDDEEYDSLISIENVVGTVHADTIDGGEGGNVITGNGGADTIYGMGGNDILVFEDQAQLNQVEQVNGGSGIDTLRIGGEIIDLSQVHSVSSIEAVDVRGNGANLVALSAQDVIDLSNYLENDVDTMTIFGDSADKVSFQDAGWTLQDGGPVNVGGVEFNVYVADAAKLYVQEDVQVQLASA